MSDEAPARGRLFVVTGGDAAGRAELAHALATRLDRSIVVDCSAFNRMVVSDRGTAPDDPTAGPEPRLGRIRQLLLSWSAGLATAETYQLEGYDAVVTDDLHGEHLEDFLDLASPETVLLVVLDEGGDHETPRWGLWVGRGQRPAGDRAEDVLARLDDARVLTTEEPSGPE